jgi:uncharacterized protein YjiS (DUF1127 family)
MLNTTQNQRKKSAAIDHNKKLILEASLIPKLNSIFNNYANHFHNTFATTGTIPATDEFHDKMHSTLTNHYQKVNDEFSQRIVNEVGAPDNHETIMDSHDARMNNHIASRAIESAAIITQTTNKDVFQSISNAQSQATNQGRIFTQQELASQSRLELRRKNNARLNTIAITETQNPAETSKQNEFSLLIAHKAVIAGVAIASALVNKKKQWVTILDNVTREAHAEADSQIVDVNDPYIVNGQSLMLPGDMSLGATIDNIINCRCSSVPIIG